MPKVTAAIIHGEITDLVNDTLNRTDELLSSLRPMLTEICDVVNKEQEQPPRVIYTEEQRAKVRAERSAQS